jgi:exodeoxyribonuclease V beta subunit
MRRQGVASLFRTVAADEDLAGRVLAGRDGERELTDLGHIAELLHAEATASQLGPSVLRAWLARRVGEADDHSAFAEADERSRRLDSDAEAIQVLTVHRAKGLEFPIVYCPYLWDAGWEGRKGRPVVFHDESDGNRRKLDVGGTDGALYDRHYRAHHEEERGEDLRHLYVALTRAKHQAVIYWARVWHCQHSPLGRLLMFRDADGNVDPNGPYVPKDEDVEAKLSDLAQRAPGCISVERCTGPDEDHWQPAAGLAGSADLRVASFGRSLDLRWRRRSYSSITAEAHVDPIGSEPEQPGTIDEPGVVVAAGAADPADEMRRGVLQGLLSPWATIPSGAEVGTFVHAVAEQVDFSADDLNADLLSAIAGQQSRYSVDVGGPETLAAAIEAAISTPLGPVAGGARLRDIARGDRLDEVGFELPLAGGDQPADAASTADVARLFAEALDGSGVLDGYATRLADPLLATELRGYLTGSLDLVFRLGGDDGTQRYFVADYKTNWLGGEGEPLSLWHYRPAALDAEMQLAHYPLQAIFYQVALHRYLRWRLPGYDPEQHLGGVLYLFVRGMAGPDTPTVDGQPCGVFAWKPAVGLAVGLSDLFDRGSAKAVAS